MYPSTPASGAEHHSQGSAALVAHDLPYRDVHTLVWAPQEAVCWIHEYRVGAGGVCDDAGLGCRRRRHLRVYRTAVHHEQVVCVCVCVCV
jgi:hypothetical protein